MYTINRVYLKANTKFVSVGGVHVLVGVSELCVELSWELFMTVYYL